MTLRVFFESIFSYQEDTMREFRITLQAKFNEEDLKKTFKLDSIKVETLPQIITDYLMINKKEKEALEQVRVKEVLVGEEELIKDLLS